MTHLGLLKACLFVTRQAAEGLISRNAAAGIRTRHTQASDDAWASGHRAALPALRKMMPVAGIGIIAALTAQVLLGGQAGPLIAFAALIAQIVVLFRSTTVANAAARTATKYDPEQ
ncbi:SdpI family protein [Arthrobacter sp. Soc17.1.1.1]|uniref:SdpI family protein n=1 Tax=Arthrobacter sp. Soc17.1.1.1 TaxID=3121277 RepID=UPI002FE4A666